MATAQISAFLGCTLAEICHRAAQSLPEIATLTDEQELRLVSDPKLLLVAVCVLNRWEAVDIGRAYELSAAEILKRLIVLDRMGLIELLNTDGLVCGSCMSDSVPTCCQRSPTCEVMGLILFLGCDDSSSAV